MSSVVGSLRVLLGLDAAEFTTGLTKAEAVAAKFADRQKRNQLAIDRQVRSLQNQAAQVGKTSQEIKLMELAQKGATVEQLRSADAALRSVAAHELVQQQMAAVKVGAAALGAALAASALAYAAFLKGQVDAIDAFNDVADATGASIENISALDDVARRTGGTFDDVGSALLKLNNTLKDADGYDAQSRAIKALGLDLQTLKSLDPAEAFLQIAIALGGFDDNATKSRYELLLFGKQTRETAHLLKDLGEQGKLVAKTTTEQAEAVERYNKNLFELKANSEDTGRAIVNFLVPAINETIKKLKEGAAEGKSFLAVIANEQWKALGRLFNISGEEPFAARAERIRNIQKLLEDQNLPLERRLRLEKQLAQLQPALDSKAGAGRGFVNPETVKPDLPEIATDNGLDALKKRLEGQLQAVRDFAEQQRDAYEFANRYVDGVYADGLISLEEHFGAQKRLREAALASQVAELTKEIALQQEMANNRNFPEAARLDADGKAKKAIRDRAQAVQKAAQDEILAEQRRGAEVEQNRRRYEDLITTIKELGGDTKGAAKDRIAQQVEDAKKLITKAGGNPAVADNYGAALNNAEALREAQDEYQKLLERTSAKEEEIGLAAQASGATEIETLRAVGEARSKSLAELSALVDKVNELAIASGNKDALAFADRLSLAYKKAAAEVDPLLQKVRSVGQELGQGLGDIFGDAIQKGHGLKSVLTDIGNLVSQTATKELISKPLGKMFGDLLGGTGKDGGVLGSLFGVGGGGKGGGGLDAAAASTTTSFSTLQTVGIDPTVTALVKFQSALGASGATGSGGGSGGGGLLDSIGGWFGSLFGGSSGGGYSYNDGVGTTNAAGISGGRANGGPVAPGGMFEVAEKRPELLDVNGRKFLLMGKQRGRIDPNPQVGGGSGRTVNANIVVQMPPGSSSQTMNQAGARVARQLQLANMRNN